MTYTVGIEGMEFHAFHGLYPEEKINGNKLRVNIKVDFEVEVLPDSPASMADYAWLAEWTHNVMTGPRVDLLESLTQNILNGITSQWDEAFSVQIKIEKMKPALLGNPILTFVEVKWEKVKK